VKIRVLDSNEIYETCAKPKDANRFTKATELEHRRAIYCYHIGDDLYEATDEEVLDGTEVVETTMLCVEYRKGPYEGDEERLRVV